VGQPDFGGEFFIGNIGDGESNNSGGRSGYELDGHQFCKKSGVVESGGVE